MRFELSINLRVAKALGISVPHDLSEGFRGTRPRTLRLAVGTIPHQLGAGEICALSFCAGTTLPGPTEVALRRVIRDSFS